MKFKFHTGQLVKICFNMSPHSLQWIAFHDLGIADNVWTVSHIDQHNQVEPYEIITLDQHKRIIVRHAHETELIAADETN